MNKLYTIILALSLLFTSGCSWFEDDDEDTFQPAPLPDISKQFSVSSRWSVQVGDGVGEFYNKLAPVVYNGRVYAADSQGLVKAIDISNGKEIWSTDVGSEIFGGVAAGSGLVAVGSTEAEVIVLDAVTGEEKWRNLVSSEIVAAPAVSDGKVLSRTTDGKLFAMDAISGERVWLYDRTVPALTLRGTSSISVGRGAAVTGFANGKVALFLLETGQAVWEKRVATASGRSELDRVVDADATPMIVGEIVYAVTFKGNIAAFNMRDGQVVWQRELSSYQNMSISGQLISVTDARSNVKVLDKRTGATLWTQDLLVDRRLTAPVVFGDYLVAGDFEGYLHWFDRHEGHLVSRNSIGGGGIVADPVVDGDNLYIYTRNGSLYSFGKP
ncbi:MAG: outer membrane protein assembly factor BamB [Gammaproteobacteria bacterium]|nr:outer membrane protein assembly factor BamB [Gammaproteobacteria bacterium]